MFFEPDPGRLNTVFWAEWRNWFSPNRYRVVTVDGKKEIHWLDSRGIPNGSILYPRHRWITGSPEHAADMVRGPNLHLIIDDEAAIDFSQEFYTNAMGRLRLPGEVCGYVTLSTPKVGPYGNMIAMAGHRHFQGKSSDNEANLRVGFLASIRAQMTEMQARRELDGELIALEGRVWTCWNDAVNISTEMYNRNKPYLLAGDIGVQSSWLIIQRYNDHYTIVGEYHADSGGTRDDLPFVLAKWGRPSKIIVGQDVRSNSVAGGDSAAIEIKKALERERMSTSVQIVTPTEIDPAYRDKFIQYEACCTALELGRIRLSAGCTSAHGYAHTYGNKARSFYNMIQQDAWPKPGAAHWFAKDKLKKRESAIEDTRDAFMYFSVVEFTPRVGSGGR